MPPKQSSAPSLPAPPLGTFIDNDTLKLVELLGIGGYGVVYRAVDPVGRNYAVKCLIRSQVHNRSSQFRLHMREITLHSLASAHPNVVTLYRVVEERNTYLVMDYAPDRDLFSQILYHSRYLGQDFLIKYIFLQLLDAVEYCHSLGIYHRDLKPENVLCFDGGLRVAITDFGLATTDRLSDEFCTGSPYHMSPECRGGEFAPIGCYSPLFNDVWSLGLILLNLATGRNPWKLASPSDARFKAYLQDPLNFLPTILPISTEVNVIICRMLDVDWRRRMTIPAARTAIQQVTHFYAEDVVFQGSMAHCSWEIESDSDSDSDSDSSTHAEDEHCERKNVKENNLEVHSRHPQIRDPTWVECSLPWMIESSIHSPPLAVVEPLTLYEHPHATVCPCTP